MPFTTVPQLASLLQEPIWLIRRLADRLGGAPRVGPRVRLIDADLAKRIEGEIAARRASQQKEAARAS